ncbi:MAG: nuclear transport factor 2 family protein [Nitrospira sp.]|nr:nuclear transport factor 2 family protein [Nitrospira sp.]
MEDENVDLCRRNSWPSWCAAILASAMVFVVACKNKKSPKPENGPSAPVIVALDASVPDAAPVLTEQAVTALVDRWLAAQNAGDFSAYSALYSETFTGVLRTGGQAKELDHDGWLASRKRMFERAMEVGADDLQVSLQDGTHAMIRFVQRWASGRYRDYGPKTMTVVVEQGVLRISREEMLESHTVKHRSHFAFLLDGYGLIDEPVDSYYVDTYGVAQYGALAPERVHYMIVADQAKDEWAKGRARYLWKGALQRVVARPVDDQSLPGELSRWKHREVTLFDESGNRCSVRIGELAIIAQGSYRENIPVEHDDESETPPTADEFWDRARHKRLVGRIMDSDGACSGRPRWARAHDQKMPQLLVSVSTDAFQELVTAAMQQLPSLPGYQRFVAAAAENNVTTDTRALTVNVFNDTDGNLQPRYVAISGSALTGCEYTNYWVILEATYQKDTFTLAAVAESRSEAWTSIEAANPTNPAQRFTPILAADLDGDGHVEFASDRTLLSWDGVGFQFTQGIEFHDPPFECGD